MNRRHRTTLATDITEIHPGDILAFRAAGHADAAARRFRKDDETERQES